MGKLNVIKYFWLRRPLFTAFIAALIIVFAACELMLSGGRSSKATENINAVGEVYREAWNSSSDFIFTVKSGKDKKRILISGASLGDVYVKELIDAGFAVLKTEAVFPEIAGNFKEFDYCKYLKSHNIDCCAYPDCNEIYIAQSTEKYSHGIEYFASSVRNDLYRCMAGYMGDEFGGWVMSVMTGYTGGLEKSEKSALSFAGFSHLVAVSGAHIAFFSMPFDMILRKTLLGAAKRNMSLLIPAFFLWFVAGGSPSVSRAVIMTAVGAFASALRRAYDGINALGLAGLIQILINPFCIYSTGFILSYSASMSMLVILPAIRKKIKIKGSFAESLSAGIAVNTGMLPLLLYMFNSFSIIGALANTGASAAASFLCSGGYAVYLLDKMCLPKVIIRTLSKAIVGAADIFRSTAYKIADGESFLYGIRCASPPIILIIIYYLVLIMLLTGTLSVRKLAAVCLASATVFAGGEIYQVELLFFDVGQGNAALIRTVDGIAGIVDTGDGGVSLSRLLLKEGVGKLDFAVVSHGHKDHYGGLEELIKNIDVGVVFVPDNGFDEYCTALSERKDICVKIISEECTYKLGKYSEMRMFESGLARENLNDGSIVVELYGKWGNVLLPGDAEETALEEFMEKGKIKKSTVLCLPHHGSVTSGSEKFLYAAMPEYVIISVGQGNRYGHPSEIVLNRLACAGVPQTRIYRTDIDGAVRIKAGVFARFKEFVFVWRKKVKLSQLLPI